MLENVWEQVWVWLGYGQGSGSAAGHQIVIRTIAVYAVTLFIVRVGSKRFLSQATAFDTVIGIMLGSVMSRAIDGSSSMLPTMLAGIVLVTMHWLTAALALRIDWFGTLVKGNPILLIEDGKVQKEGMRRARLSENDLEQALRMRNDHTDPAYIKTAYLERSGTISVIPLSQKPRVVEIDVENGVQTVRVEFN